METPARKPDRRIIKTKRAIRTAFAQLVAEKDLKSITIKDISDRADINRKTFYNYYESVSRIVDEIEDEMIAACVRVLDDVDFSEVLQNPTKVFDRMTSAISKDVEFYSLLFRAGNNGRLIAKIVTVLKDMVKESFARQITVEPDMLNMMADFIISGGVAAFQGWLSGNYSRDDMEIFSKRLSILITRGVNGLLAAERVEKI